MINFIFAKLSFITKFRIPTVLGLALLLIGLGAGVFLVLQNQTLTSRASADQNPQNITISNISGHQAVISWQTGLPSTGFITFGQNSAAEQTVLDERDQTTPQTHFSHYVILNNLNTSTTYQFKVVSGKNSSGIQKFTTAPTDNQNNLKPLIGTVAGKDTALDDGLAYLSITPDIIKSSLVKNGNFIIPLANLSIGDDTIGKLSIFSNDGTATALLRLADIQGPITPLKLGDNIDLTINQTPPPTASPSAAANSNLAKYDLNGDGLINAQDYAIVLRNFGKSPQDSRADLNGDGVVDQKDLELMSKKISSQKK